MYNNSLFFFRQIINIPISPKIVTSTSESIIGNSTPFIRSAISSIQTTKTVGTCTSSDSIYLSKTGVNKATKSVAAQMALEDLLDEIDVNLVLESAARRCTPDKLLIQYKVTLKFHFSIFIFQMLFLIIVNVNLYYLFFIFYHMNYKIVTEYRT